jgi:hypothetical protein
VGEREKETRALRKNNNSINHVNRVNHKEHSVMRDDEIGKILQ